MKVAFPVKENNGLESVIDEHFGVAQFFLVVDTETREFELKENQKLLSDASKCKTSVLGKDGQIDAVITNCMGDGSQRSLASSNIKVYQALKKTVLENLELLEKDELKLFHMFDFCQIKKNKKEGGCGHHH
ncbi:MAG: dinitrogenase iron-molybdenum cofactor [Proteobacteria bacterium]|nr:dinitrogenase iron-molybdenum cofactor [Pseudomonadota bacterium]MBU1583349.1 dinitrogenase iron-molybdenum cofactor [Pseudomonadota bacterium]MBU2631367.1 dinitrogenase iron-molybdenum cofactor [Pseudomonadota bacterium]